MLSCIPTRLALGASQYPYTQTAPRSGAKPREQQGADQPHRRALHLRCRACSHAPQQHTSECPSRPERRGPVSRYSNLYARVFVRSMLSSAVK